MFITTNENTMYKVVANDCLEGMYHIEIDGVQVSEILTYKECVVRIMDLTNVCRNYTFLARQYNMQADLYQPAEFIEYVNGCHVTIIAYFKNGDYADIFSYDRRDYVVPMNKLNSCVSGVDGLAFCIACDTGKVNRKIS